MAEILFVGTGDAFGSGGRRQSAILVREAGKTLLLDCGPTTVGGLNALGVDPREVDAIAITHYHGDHIGGVPFLMIDYAYAHARDKPLVILGPRGIEKRIGQLVEIFEYRPDLDPRFPIEYREFEIGRTQHAFGFGIHPLPAHHHPNTEPHMLRVRAGEREILFTGDTGWHENLPEYVGRADLFIAECAFLDEKFEYHLSHERLDAERRRFACERTILTHLGSEILDNTEKVHFDLAHDNLRLVL